MMPYSAWGMETECLSLMVYWRATGPASQLTMEDKSSTREGGGIAER